MYGAVYTLIYIYYNELYQKAFNLKLYLNYYEIISLSET